MAQSTNDISLGNLANTTVLAASPVTGKQLLTTPDDFVWNQSRFDRQARLNLEFDVVDVSLPIYQSYVGSQVMAWTADEISLLKKIVAHVGKKFAPFKLHLPDTVFLVKTTGQEEGYAAYTRQTNVIVLPENMVASLAFTPNWGDPLHPASSVTYLENIIIHEFFHLFSKNNRARREQLYRLVHYKVTGNELQLPDIPWGTEGAGYSMRDFKITNPDAPLMDVYIEMAVPENPDRVGSGDTKDFLTRPLMPILLATRLYSGGVFFDSLQWWFMVIEKNSDRIWAPLLIDNKPVLYDSTPLIPQYLKLIGHNLQGELFHPDEILAQNFVFAANLPSLDLLLSFQKALES